MKKKQALKTLTVASLALGAAGAINAQDADASVISFKSLGTAAELRAEILRDAPEINMNIYAGSHGGDHGDEGDSKDSEGKCGEGKCGEGKCGEGKCGGDKEGAEGKCGEGKCGGDKEGAEGKCGEGKCGEGKCGEGKCGGDKAKEAVGEKAKEMKDSVKGIKDAAVDKAVEMVK